MNPKFADILKELRHQKNLSQQQLANKLQVDRSSIAKWESGKRIPDINTITQLAEFFEVNVSELIGTEDMAKETPIVILVDDEDILIQGALPILQWAMPNAIIKGFTKVSEAVEFTKNNKVSIAFLDIEIGKQSGLELSKTLIEINSHMNIIFLTSYPDYALNAWDTPACGFLVKPIQLEDIQNQLNKLRHQVRGLI